MPAYVCMEEAFLPSLTLPTAETSLKTSGVGFHGTSSDAHQRRRKKRSRWEIDGPVYLCPTKRYCFQTPQGWRGWEGHYTSPLETVWYVNLGPVCTRYEFIKRAT